MARALAVKSACWYPWTANKITLTCLSKLASSQVDICSLSVQVSGDVPFCGRGRAGLVRGGYVATRLTPNDSPACDILPSARGPYLISVNAGTRKRVSAASKRSIFPALRRARRSGAARRCAASQSRKPRRVARRHASLTSLRGSASMVRGTRRCSEHAGDPCRCLQRSLHGQPHA